MNVASIKAVEILPTITFSNRVVNPLSTYTNSRLNGNVQDGLSPLKLSIASTFTSNPVEDVLRFWSKKFGYKTTVNFSPYDQVFQELLNQNSSLNHPENDARVVFLRMDDWIRNLSDTGASSIHRHIVTNINFLSEYAAKAGTNVESPLFVIIARNSRDSLISLENQNEYEQLLRNDLSAHSNIYVTTSGDIDKTYGVEDYYDAQKDQLGHIPFTPDYFAALGTSVFRHVHSGKRSPFKVIVLDCDHTLWGGVCGEVSPDQLTLSEPYASLQSFMLRQKATDKILCLCSKNVQEDVERVFRERSDMLIREEDIVTSKINWHPKSRNLIDLAKELNLGLDSFIFVDDNPVECAEVRVNCPEVLTLNLPEKPEEISAFLDHVWAFDTLKTTREDENRTQLYKENIERAGLQQRSSTFIEFIDGLNLDIRITKATPEEFGRVSQLTYRTNQFNFTTIRRSEEQIRELIETKGFTCAVCRVSDRFGEYGLVGVMFYKLESDRILLDSFMLSCRVLGRGVEHRMLRSIGEAAQAHDLGIVQVQFAGTEKNLPARNFLKSVLRGMAGTVQTTESGYLLESGYLSGFMYNPDIQPLGKIRVNGQGKKPFFSTSSMIQSLIFEQIAKELRAPSTIAGLLQGSNGSGARRTVNSSVTEREPLQIITGIWERILDREGIGPNEHFFDVGGTSLKAVGVLSELNERFNKNLTIVSLFEHSTIRSLVDFVERQEPTNGEFNKIIQRSKARRSRTRRRE